MCVIISGNCCILSPGDVAAQFTAPPPTCPGNNFTFRCNVTGDMSRITLWRVGGGSSSCPLLHNSPGTPTCGPGSVFTARAGSGFDQGTNATSFSSTLSGTATSELNGTLVECFAGLPSNGNAVGNSTLQILGECGFTQ